MALLVTSGCDCGGNLTTGGVNGDDGDDVGIGGDVNGVDPDADGGDTDTGPDGPVDPCAEIVCPDGELCYEGVCFDACNNDLECLEDNARCVEGRCAPVDCAGVECPDDHACYRGSCYEQCTEDADCPGEGGITCADGACVSLDDQCENLECEQLNCPHDAEPTGLSGVVHTPSGDFPLPNVSVYVPNDDLDPLPDGASCDQCEDLISGDPLVQNVTDIDGSFYLPNVPAADEVPLVIQSGKWRREVTITDVEPCTNNQITDHNLTRLPRNQSEGNLPQIAVSTGGCDELECLVSAVGLDDSEFTTHGGGGAVHLYDGGGGSNFDSGTSYPHGSQLWENQDRWLEYDIFLDACDCSSNNTGDKSNQAMQNFETFLNSGGRAFMSHFEKVWLKYGTSAMQSVINWRSSSVIGVDPTVEVNTDHAGGEAMRDWLAQPAVNVIDGNNQMHGLSETRLSAQSANEPLAYEYIQYPSRGYDPAYLGFNTPVGAAEEDECGRAVFADIHVAQGHTARGSFPSLCSTSGLTEQEIALVYMLFDLSACIAPECDPLTCDDVENNCGIHPDGCGGTISCGVCCVEIDEPCDNDDDCCGSLWCDDDTGTCTDRCRVTEERCTRNSQCCSESCHIEPGENQGECTLG